MAASPLGSIGSITAAAGLAAAMIWLVYYSSSAPMQTFPLTDADIPAIKANDHGLSFDSMLQQLPPCTSGGTTPESAFDRANALKKQERFLEALACYGKTISLDPGHPGAYNNMATSLKRSNGLLQCGAELCSNDELRRLSSASLQTVIRLNPRHANAYTNLASNLRSDYRLDEAISLLMSAVTIEPRHVTLRPAPCALHPAPCCRPRSWSSFAVWCWRGQHTCMHARTYMQVMAFENLGRALQANSAPTEAPAQAAPQQGAGSRAQGAGRGEQGAHPEYPELFSSGGWRWRQPLVEAAWAYRSALRLAGTRASRDAYRGLGYSLLWLDREEEVRADG